MESLVSESASARRFEALLEHRSVGVLLMDDAGRIDRANERVATLLGVRAPAIVGSRLQDHAWDADRALLAALLERSRGEGSAIATLRLRASPGRPVRAELWIHRLDADGSLVQVRDLSGPEHELARRAAEAADRAGRMAAVARLAGGLANDFNNLLSVVINYADFSRQRLTADHPVREYLEAIRRAGLRASSLTRQLLLFGGRDSSDARALDVNRALEELAPLLQRTVGEGIEVRLALDPAVHAARIPPTHLQRILVHLAANARDAMPLGGRLLLRTEQLTLTESEAAAAGVSPGAYVRLGVEDTGVGMTEEVALHAFEPFFTTKDAGPGVGIGLSLAWGMSSAVGGALSVETTPGEGATFHVLLPCSVEVPTVETVIQPEPVPVGRGESVLVVDDEPEVRDLTVRILQDHGYTVRGVDGPDAALDLVTRREEAVDLLLTDVIMPRMHGNDLAAYVRALRPGMRVLFMSGFTDGRLTRTPTWDKDAGFLQKPFDTGQLLRAVRRVLDDPGPIRPLPR